jgi:hypothetical protein
MGAVQLKASARGTNPETLILSTALNGTGSTVVKTTAATIENATSLDLWMDLELFVAFASNPVVGETIDVFINRTVDGTNYGASAVGINEHVGSFKVANANTSTQRLMLRDVALPPRNFKVSIRNNSVVAFSSVDTHTLKGYCYTTQVS